MIFQEIFGWIGEVVNSMKNGIQLRLILEFMEFYQSKNDVASVNRNVKSRRR